MIKIENLKASIDDKDILKGIDLEIPAGEVHVIMGRNGSGKSTLANVIAGNETYEVDGGNLSMENTDITEMSIENRALEGIFLCFQYPVAIPGVSMAYFLRSALNAHRKYQGKEEMDALEFLNKAKAILSELSLDDSFLKRSINDGFSGGEKKKSEILQLLTINPKLAVLDETDSGLDVDALRTVAKGVNKFKDKNNSVLIITHYQRLLDYIKPDVVHLMIDGKIVKSGDMSLVEKVEKDGYSWLEK
ncbi:MAG: Fe-S cluster assembly ATPase SufC [Candidatus Pelagibacter sp. TMED118]|nr:MAG: Fe-S cluster assembly ATPase SufC [Candidatus Pelagibacter sp. TMED118]|tara:strand:+ start:1856 stop:2596 length:741 start_codon:yes stop_codon:yes gene_type:complete